MAWNITVGPVTVANNSLSKELVLEGCSAGNSIIVGVVWNSTVGLTSVTCSDESNLTLHGSATVVAGSNYRLQFASLAEVTSSGDKTVTVNIGGSFGNGSVFAMEVSGGNTGDFFDAVNGGTPLGPDPSVTLTTAEDGALVIGMMVIGDSTEPVEGSEYTALEMPNWATPPCVHAEYTLDAGDAGEKTVDFTHEGELTAGVVAISFNPVPPPNDGTADLTLPSLEIDGQGHDTDGTAELTLPSLTVEVGTGETLGDVDETLPALTISAEGTGGGLADADLDLPVYTVSATGSDGTAGTLEEDLTLHTISAEGTGGTVGTVSEFLPRITLSASATTEHLGTAELVLPSLTILAGHMGGVVASLPLLTLDATGVAGSLGEVQALMPLLSLDGVGSFDNVGGAVLTLPPLSLDTVGLLGSVGTMSATLPSWLLDATAKVGADGAAALVLPLYSPSTAGFADVAASADLVLPALVLEATGFGGVTVAYRTWVLNLRTRALSEYKGLTFNSYARFDGKVLAVSDGGLFVLGDETDDNGEEIAGLVRTARSDFDTSRLKRVPRVYLDYASQGHVEVRTITSEDGRRRYILAPNGVSGTQQRRVPVGQGPKSRWWQFEVANRDGADFTLGGVLAYPSLLKRRIQ